MKTTKFLVAFLLTFLIGSFAIWLIKSFSVQNVQPNNSAPAVSTAPSVAENLAPQLPVYDVESFWNDSAVQQNSRLLETGEVTNGDDIKAKSGEIWLGLFSENNREMLRPTEIKIARARKHDFDWKSVAVKDKANPLFLVKKSANLKTGAIRTLFLSETVLEDSVASDSLPEDRNPSDSLEMKDGFTKNFKLGARDYTLRVEKALSEDRRSILVLRLETENTSQIIHSIYYSGEGEGVGNLYWAGDLDDDGKLDLYMDFWGYEKGYYNSGLFLSSEAEDGKLVNKIEYFALSAC